MNQKNTDTGPRLGGYGLFVILLIMYVLSNLIGIGDLFAQAPAGLDTPVTGAVTLSTVCPLSDYVLRSQGDVNGFPTGCSEITGGLSIGPSFNITDLSPLAAVTIVGQSLNISQNPVLTNIDGLSGLTSVGRDLWLRWNEALTNIDALSKLTSVRSIEILDNETLVDIDGFSSLSTVRSITVSDNPSLTDLDGFSGITSLHVGGSLSLYRNDALTNLSGLSGLTSVGGVLTISQNAGLTNLEGLSGITFVGNLDISRNPALTNIDALSQVTGGVGYLTISDNDTLANIDGLSGLTSAYAIDITDNALLTNLDGFSGITSIGTYLNVVGNDVLTYCSCGLYTCINSNCVEDNITMSANAPSGDCNNDGTDLAANACFAPDAVSLLQPDDGATQVAAYTAFTWQPIEGAAAYHLQLSGDAAFTTPMVDDSTLTEATLALSAPLAYSMGYYWHVRAALDDGLGKTTSFLFGPWSETRSFTVAVGTATESDPTLPTAFALHPAYPNPFNPATTLTYDLPEAAHVRLVVFDGLGRVVESLVNSHQSLGTHSVTWSAHSVPSGVYFVRMEAGSFTQTRRMILTK